MKKSNWIFLWFGLFILLSACSKKTKTPIVTPSPSYDVDDSVLVDPTKRGELSTTKANRTYIIASLQKLGCYGNCPDFEFILLSNGEATFLGKKNTKRIGNFKAQANASILFNIKSKIGESQFFQFEKMYPTNGNILKDLPDTYTLVNDGKQEHIVRNNHDAPKELLEFEKYLEELIEQMEWKEVTR